MTSLFWPGDARAGDLFTDRAFLEAMVVVEGGLGRRDVSPYRTSSWTPSPAATP